MTEDAVAEIARILDETPEADEALSRVVQRLAAEPGVAWAGIALVERDTLVLGPSAGAPDESTRTHVPIAYRDDVVGELLVDGVGADGALRRIADLLAPLALIGWDTGGEAWEP